MRNGDGFGEPGQRGGRGGPERGGRGGPERGGRGARGGPPLRRRREPAAGLPLAVDRIGDRWTLLVVNALLDGPRRFNELSEDLPGIAPNVLSQRLRQLEGDQLVVAEAYSQRPVRFTYELTDRGAGLAGALRMLSHWGAEQAGGDAGVVHQACGTVAEPRWWCSTCDDVLEDDELDDLRWV